MQALPICVVSKRLYKDGYSGRKSKSSCSSYLVRVFLGWVGGGGACAAMPHNYKDCLSVPPFFSSEPWQLHAGTKFGQRPQIAGLYIITF